MVLGRRAGNDAAVADTTLQAFRELGLASDWATFRAALAKMVCPSQNFVFADAATGTVGYQMPGKIPVRPKPSFRGRLSPRSAAEEVPGKKSLGPGTEAQAVPLL